MSLVEDIERVLSLLQPNLAQAIRGNIEIRQETRTIRGKEVDATYDGETGRIIFWGQKHLDELDLVIILMHEVGHFIYQRMLSGRKKAEWVRIYQKEKIDFELEKYYLTVQIPEETFCSVVSSLGVAYWLEALNMREKAKIAKQDLERKGSESVRFVESVLQKDIRRESKEIYHSQVVKIRKWIEDLIGPLPNYFFPKERI